MTVLQPKFPRFRLANPANGHAHHLGSAPYAEQSNGSFRLTIRLTRIRPAAPKVSASSEMPL